ncbi:hypothetical protein QPL51_04660 [Escherichia coli]|uniref:hypothetical protein n=1 Tax=Escherichia coli TaxID=562 RepID=UPI0027A663ED|nr:hypothetical protein [Escherichia coli]EKR8628451.1 hypothetical protein [Escherichia coli]ELQ3159109.1 hypothetical protein [Escherichia coli]MDS1552329.1 hypothetical protein [Escherichia coli]WIL00602.1 hypothetical protein [Escherichia phage vB_EcoM_CRJP21]
MNPTIVQDLKQVIFLLNTRSEMYTEFKEINAFYQNFVIQEFSDLITDALFELSEKYKGTEFSVKNVLRSLSKRIIKLDHFTFDNKDLFSHNPSTALYFIPDSDKNHPIHYGWILSYIVQGKEYPIKWND